MRISSWLKNLVGAPVSTENESVKKSENIEIVDPNAVGEETQAKIRPLTVSIVGRKNDMGEEDAVVLAYWEKSLKKVYEKPYKTIDEASVKFLDISGRANGIKDKIAGGSFPEAEEASKKLLLDLQLENSPAVETSAVLEKVDIASVGIFTENKFQFHDLYLNSLLRPIDITTSPASVFKGSFPSLIYATHKINHIGKDDFVLQWFPKILTSEGMIEDVALVEKTANGRSLYFTVPDCNKSRFEKICRRLTPTYEDIGYELKNGGLQKKAVVTVLFFETPDEAAKYQKLVTPPAGPSASTPATPPPPSAAPSKNMEEAGKALSEAKGPAGPKGVPQMKMEQQENKLKEATSSLRVVAKDEKKKALGKFDKAEDPERNAQSDFRLSKWDSQAPSDSPSSAESVLALRYLADLGTYEVTLPQGIKTHLNRDTAKMYLLNEGYQLEDANAHLDAAKKGEVELRENLPTVTGSSTVKLVITSLLKKRKAQEGEILVNASKMANVNLSSAKAAFDELESNKVIINRNDLYLLAESDDARIMEIADLLKTSDNRRKAFAEAVENSAKLKEISKEDLEQFKTAMTKAETLGSEGWWQNLAIVSEQIFHKAKKSV